MHKTVFLDRDGTIMIDKVYLNDPGQIVYLEGAFEGLKIMRDLGYKFVVVTNQSGMPRGKVTVENLDKIHKIISHDFAKHGIHFLNFYYAPFMTDSNHMSRKPNMGMLQYANFDFGIDFSKSWMIGDRMTDVEAGHRAGCRSILIEGFDDPSSGEFDPPEGTAKNLLEAARFIERFPY
jgi:histidinol-phosphate phosphatase family protein